MKRKKDLSKFHNQYWNEVLRDYHLNWSETYLASSKQTEKLRDF